MLPARARGTDPNQYRAGYHVARGWRLSGWVLLVLAATLTTAAARAAEPRPDGQGTTPAAVAAGESDFEPGDSAVEQEAGSAEPLTYSENQGWQDFEVHFFVSLPFTALYSYLALTSLDAAVQGRFPPEFRQTDMWMVIGMAVGSSLAIALGSLDRVPDQSQDVLPAAAQPLQRPIALAALEIRF